MFFDIRHMAYLGDPVEIAGLLPRTTIQRVPSGPPRFEDLPEQYFAALLARVRAVSADGGEPIIDLGRGNPETGPPPHVVEALGPRLPAGCPRLRAVPWAPRLREAIAPGIATSTASSSTRSARSRSCPARRRRSSSWRSSSPTRARRCCCPTRTTRTIPPGSRSPAPSRAAPARPGRRLGARSRRRAGGGGRLPQLPVEPVRGVRAARASSRRPSSARSAPATAIVHDAAYIDLVFDGRAAGELPRDAGREGRRRRDVDDVEDLRHGGLADRLRRRQRRDRRAHQPASTTTRASASSRRCRKPRSPRSKGRRTRSTSASRRTNGAATRSPPRCPEPPVCEGTFYVWVRLPERADRREAAREQRVALAPGEGFGPSGAGWARLSLAVTDETLERGVERLAPAFAAAYA